MNQNPHSESGVSPPQEKMSFRDAMNYLGVSRHVLYNLLAHKNLRLSSTGYLKSTLDSFDPALIQYVKDQLVTTAYHEAGHAVAAVLLRLDFREVSIEADGSTLGHQSSHVNNRLMSLALRKVFVRDFRIPVEEAIVLASEIAAPKIAARAEKWIVRAFAGYHAEYELSERRPEFKNKIHRGVSGDFYQAGRLAEGYKISEERVMKIHRKTARFVKKHWNEIQNVAEALLGHGNISREEIHWAMKGLNITEQNNIRYAAEQAADAAAWEAKMAAWNREQDAKQAAWEARGSR